MSDDAKELLEILNNTQKDALYLKSRQISIRGTYNIIKTWCITYGLTSLLLLSSIFFIQPKVPPQYFETFAMWNRVGFILLHLACILTYLLALKFNTVTAWEKERLIILTPTVILLSLTQMLYPLSYYIPDLYSIYSILLLVSFDTWLCLIFLTILYVMSKNKEILIILILNSLFILFVIFVNLIASLPSENASYFIQIKSIILLLNQSGCIVLTFIILALLSLKRRITHDE